MGSSPERNEGCSDTIAKGCVTIIAIPLVLFAVCLLFGINPLLGLLALLFLPDVFREIWKD